jgi:flagellar secretion chaperone FliS
MNAALQRTRYVTDSVETLPPARLVTMLYDALVNDLTLAEQAIGRGDRDIVNARLTRAQDIVLELRSSLDTATWAGGPGLASLYAFLLTEMITPNVTQDAPKVASCRTLVEPLRDAWHRAAMAVAASA